MPNIDKIAETYQCPKCRDKSPVVKKITLPQSSLQSIFPLGSGKYILLTCGLCGYTEIYDAAVYAKADQEAERKSRLPDQANPTI